MTFQPGQIPVGRVLGGGWRVLRPLGRATPRSALYAVEQQSTGRTCVLRVLDPELVAKPEGRERFGELCRARAGVRSAHVVDLIDAGVDDRTKAPWFAITFQDGPTLAERVAKAPLDEGDVFDVMGQVAQALQAIHGVGMAYGRLDPNAVMLVEGETFGGDFTARVLDFWTHAWLRESFGAKERASSLLWMSPEHAFGDEAATPADDVWSFGLLAFFAFTGRSYWRAAGDDDAIKRAAVEAELKDGALDPPSVRAESLGVRRALPEGFDDWFLRCVARDPEARFETVAAAGEALEALYGDDDEEEGDDEGDDEVPVRAAPRAVSAPRSSPRAAPAAAGEPFAQRLMRSPDLYIPVLMVLLLGGALAIRARMMRNRAGVPSANVAAAPSTAGNAAAAPGAPTPPPDQPTRTPTISDAALTQLVTALGEGRGSPAWVTAMNDDAFSVAQAERLVTAFRRAGWDVKPLQRTSLRLRPGLYLFAADTSPPEYVQTLATALSTAGLSAAFRQGYREYAEEQRRTRPDFRGFLSEEGQSFVLVVGRGEVAAQ